MVLEKIGQLLPRQETDIRHVAIALEEETADLLYAETKKLDLDELYSKRNAIVQDIVEEQVKAQIPAVTILLLSRTRKEEEQWLAVKKSLLQLLESLRSSETVMENGVKVSILGRWYDLSSELVESVKGVMDATKDNDRFFLNLCIAYDGRDELVDACRLIARRVKTEKLEPEDISHKTIKESIYNTDAMLPNVVIQTTVQKNSNFLLWDAAEAAVHWTGKHWAEFDRSELSKILSTTSDE